MATITDTIETMYTATSNAYDAVVEQGGTAPEQKNLDNLADAIKTIVPKVAMGDYGKLIWIEELGTDTDVVKLGGMPLNTVEEFNALGTPAPAAGGTLPANLTIGEKEIARANVVAFYSNQMPNEIPTGFLRDCPNLIFGQFILPNNVTAIGDSFLRACSSFNLPITLSTALTSIGALFLGFCDAFNQPIDMSQTQVESIGDYFLYYDGAFNSPVTFSSTLKTIGVRFLGWCKNFAQPIEITSGVTSIGDIFMYMTNMSKSPIHITGDHGTIGTYFCAYSVLSTNSNVNLDGDWSAIGNYFMYGCRTFNSTVTISSTNMTIGTYFLYGCVTFNQALSLPNTVKSIGDWFMTDCRSVIGNNIFDFSNGDLNPSLPFLENCTTIGKNFMRRCHNVNCAKYGGNGVRDAIFKLPSNLVSIGEYFMAECTSLYGPVDFSACTQITKIPDSLFEKCTSLLGVVFPPNITSIGRQSLAGCTGLIDEVIIPSGVKTIENYFMQDCTSYNKPFTFPVGCASKGYFMNGVANFVGPLWMNERTALGNGTGGGNLYCYDDKSPSFVKGIAITGPGAKAYIDYIGSSAISNKNVEGGKPHQQCRHLYLYDPDTDITAEDGAILITEKK